MGNLAQCSAEAPVLGADSWRLDLPQEPGSRAATHGAIPLAGRLSPALQPQFPTSVRHHRLSSRTPVAAPYLTLPRIPDTAFPSRLRSSPKTSFSRPGCARAKSPEIGIPRPAASDHTSVTSTAHSLHRRSLDDHFHISSPTSPPECRCVEERRPCSGSWFSCMSERSPVVSAEEDTLLGYRPMRPRTRGIAAAQRTIALTMAIAAMVHAERLHC